MIFIVLLCATALAVSFCPNNTRDWGVPVPFRVDYFPSFVRPIVLNASLAPARRLLQSEYLKGLLHTAPLVGPILAAVYPFDYSNSNDGLLLALISIQAQLYKTNILAANLSGTVSDIARLGAEQANLTKQGLDALKTIVSLVADGAEEFRTLSDSRFRRTVATLELLSLAIDANGQAAVRLSNIDSTRERVIDSVTSPIVRKYLKLASLSNYTGTVPWVDDSETLNIFVTQPLCDVGSVYVPLSGYTTMPLGCDSTVVVKRTPTVASYFTNFDAGIYTEEIVPTGNYASRSEFLTGNAIYTCSSQSTLADFRACVTPIMTSCLLSGDTFHPQCIVDPTDAGPTWGYMDAGNQSAYGYPSNSKIAQCTWPSLSSFPCPNTATPWKQFYDRNSSGLCSWTGAGGQQYDAACGGGHCLRNNATGPCDPPQCTPNGIRTCDPRLDVIGPNPTFFAINATLPVSYMWKYLGTTKRYGSKLYYTAFFDPIEIMKKAVPLPVYELQPAFSKLFESGNRGDNVVFAHYGPQVQLPICQIDGLPGYFVCEPGYFPDSAAMMQHYFGLPPFSGWRNGTITAAGSTDTDCGLYSGHMCCKNHSTDPTYNNVVADGGFNPFNLPANLRNEALYNRLLFIEDSYLNASRSINSSAALIAAYNHLYDVYAGTDNVIKGYTAAAAQAKVTQAGFVAAAKDVSDIKVKSSTSYGTSIFSIVLVCVFTCVGLLVLRWILQRTSGHSSSISRL